MPSSPISKEREVYGKQEIWNVGKKWDNGKVDKGKSLIEEKKIGKKDVRGRERREKIGSFPSRNWKKVRGKS